MSTSSSSQQPQHGPRRRINRVAIAQLCSTSNKRYNLIQIAKCAGNAKGGGAVMLCLPECFGFMGQGAEQTLQQAEPAVDTSTSTTSQHRISLQDNDDDANLREILRQVILQHSTTTTPLIADRDDEFAAEELDGKDVSSISLLEGLRFIAQESGLWISGGGMHVADAPHHPTSRQPRVYNTHVILDHHGQIQSLYRKIHLFDVSIPGKVELKESNSTAPGTELVVCDSPIGRLGLSTCYDLRFGEMYVPLVQDGGAQILLVPSAFTVPTGSAHWHTLLRARAIEHQCYVLAAAQYGRHNSKRESYGHSLAVDPWGQIVSDAGGYDGPGSTTIHTSSAPLSNPPLQEQQQTQTPLSQGLSSAGAPAPSVIFCDIDLDQIESVRQRMPIQQHRECSSFSFS